jgi:hypothetical protein
VDGQQRLTSSATIVDAGRPVTGGVVEIAPSPAWQRFYLQKAVLQITH